MYILKDFQEKAVGDLLQHTLGALGEQANQIPILLEAPTGSGKTVMMAAYLERMTDSPHLSDDVAFVWFAPNTLHIQSFKSIQKLYADTNKLRCIDLNDLTANPVLNPKDLLFVNWSSVDGEKKIWRKNNETNTNLQTLVENTKANGTALILIIDEAHLSAFTGPQAIAVRKLITAKVEILVTATPDTTKRPRRSVFIDRQQVIQEQMIKKGVRLNIGLDPAQQNSDNVTIHLLRKALAKKQELAKLYDDELGPNKVNPLLLIQLPSDNTALSDEDKSIRENVEGLLNSEFGISTHNGRLAVWLSGERNKDGLEDINGSQDVLIFKQAIAQGWDCPRAAILISYRRVQSSNFGIQTVGRILRMPHQRHYQHNDLNYGYVYTDIESNRISFVPSDSDFFSLQLAERQIDKGWIFDKLTSATIVNDRASKGVLASQFDGFFFKIMEDYYGISQLPERLHNFTKVSEEIELKTQIERNKQAMREKLWEFDIDEHQIKIPTDLEIDPYEVNTIMLGNDQVQRFAITEYEFRKLFDRFCHDNITRLNRLKSWKKLKQTLICFAEYYLSIDEFKIRKIFLYPQNKAYLVEHIAIALEQFEAWQTKQGNDSRRVVPGNWEVPEIRYYNELYNREAAESHALKPFFEAQNASKPEIIFKDFLAKNEVYLEWWYKNGDQGTGHFAVPYTDSHGVLRLFYVDFVVKFRNGKTGLFDTKTKRSDVEAPNKHNALIAYMAQQNDTNPKQQLLGGILIPTETANVIGFRYCTNRITDTDDLTGWDFFNPATISTN
jgi:type III restriction enzyme